MKLQGLVRLMFWLLAALVLYLALTPDTVAVFLSSDTERHYLAFLVLPAVAAYGWPRIPLPALWLAFVVFGGAIEMLQMTMHLGRVGEWRDWMNDMVATTISLVVSSVLLRVVNLRRTA